MVVVVAGGEASERGTAERTLHATHTITPQCPTLRARHTRAKATHVLVRKGGGCCIMEEEGPPVVPAPKARRVAIAFFVLPCGRARCCARPPAAALVSDVLSGELVRPIDGAARSDACKPRTRGGAALSQRFTHLCVRALSGCERACLMRQLVDQDVKTPLWIGAE